MAFWTQADLERCPVVLANMVEQGPVCARPVHLWEGDDDEQPLCLLHSRDPGKSSGILLEQFLQEISAELHRAGNGKAHFESMIFPVAPGEPGQAFLSACCFDHAEFWQDVNLSSCAFAQEVRFCDATFRGEADFENVTFKTIANFRSARFKQDVSFLRTIFLGDAYFSRNKFHGRSQFTLARFHQRALFRQTRFSERASFQGATILGAADFMEATFNDIAVFVECRFHSDVSFRKSKRHRSTVSTGTFRFGMLFEGAV